MSRSTVAPILGVAFICTVSAQLSPGDELQLTLRYQTESSPGSARYHQLQRTETWQPSETAIVVCDVWDLHHCLNAVRRIEVFAPRLNHVLRSRRSVTWDFLRSGLSLVIRSRIRLF